MSLDRYTEQIFFKPKPPMKLSNTFPEPSGSDETAPVLKSAADLPTLSEGLRQEAAGAELFAIPESKSPKLCWMERHHITLSEASNTNNRWNAKHRDKVIGYGATHDDALVAAAKSLNVKLWNEL